MPDPEGPERPETHERPATADRPETPQPPFELPSARQVVSAGLQLAVTAAKPIRRASIYIGVLSLAAFGPVAVVSLVALARLVGDPAVLDALLTDPTGLFIERPELAGPLRTLTLMAPIAALLLVAISIDAQAIAIGLLAGIAAGRPLTLAEAVTRARQSFWRLFRAGLIIGLVSILTAFVVTLPFGGTSANSGITFIGSMIGALVVTPWAYAGSGIVLGDVGARESLRRSVRLFRVRRSLALVVTLFTLLATAIQTFAIDVAFELMFRVGDVLGIGLDQGPTSLILPVLFTLALVVAFGSLIFTVGAIVASPQVVAFLGLTFYSDGLERARSRGEARSGLFHWVSVPFSFAVALMVLLGFGALSQIR
jgi:hypothetical protein